MSLPLHDFPDWQASLDTADLVVNLTSQALGGGGFVNSVILDMRSYSSYSLTVKVTTNAAATQYNQIQIYTFWTQDNAGATRMYMDNFEIFAADAGFGAFTSVFGRFDIQDAVHGAFLQISVVNTGADNCTLDLNIYGNSRTIARRYLSNPSWFDGIGSGFNDRALLGEIGTAIGAGVTVSRLLRLAPARASFILFNALATVQWRLLRPDGTTIGIWQPAAGVALAFDYSLPRTATRLTINNFGGAGTTFNVDINADFPDG